MTKRHYEDIEVGEVHDLGSYQVSAEEIQRFAERYDPQPFHVDPEAATESPYGGPIASGWHTGSICMRLAVEGFLNDTVTMGAFGLDELRWRTPLHAGDTVSATLEITGKRESGSRDDRGYIENEVTGTNGDGGEVIFWRATNIFGRRE
jgi:acyl dehydratase